MNKGQEAILMFLIFIFTSILIIVFGIGTMALLINYCSTEVAIGTVLLITLIIACVVVYNNAEGNI